MRKHLPWHEALHRGQTEGTPLVLLTVLSTAGSTPRDATSKMVVSDAEQWDTLGGGHLEYRAIAHARKLLAEGNSRTDLQFFDLGANLGQCCGGAVQVLFEVLIPRHQTLAIFGAGHVAQHLVPMLKPLNLKLHWIDGRPDWLADHHDGVVTECTDHPTDVMADLPEGAWVLILTHNHQLDFELVQTALKRPDIGYIGLIGSDTKARRFRQRLDHRGWAPEAIERVLCPVGLPEVPGKQPAEVAIAIAGQLVQRLHQRNDASARDTAAPKKVTGLNWKTARQLSLPQPHDKDENPHAAD
ncbi:MAG: xanthine dehydrogenase accessory protein XdhC [Saccharospirillum sp.]